MIFKSTVGLLQLFLAHYLKVPFYVVSFECQSFTPKRIYNVRTYIPNSIPHSPRRYYFICMQVSTTYKHLSPYPPRGHLNGSSMYFPAQRRENFLLSTGRSPNFIKYLPIGILPSVSWRGMVALLHGNEGPRRRIILPGNGVSRAVQIAQRKCLEMF